MLCILREQQWLFPSGFSHPGATAHTEIVRVTAGGCAQRLGTSVESQIDLPTTTSVSCIVAPSVRAKSLCATLFDSDHA